MDSVFGCPNSPINIMHTSTAKLGFWSALAATVAWLLFTICFLAIPASKPRFVWTDLAGFVEYARAHDRTLIYIAQACMALFGPLYVMIVSSLAESVAPERRGLLRAALGLGVGFAVLTGINYFTHITAVRFNLDRGTTAGLEQLVQHKPDSVMAAINMLGWTVYFGLSTLLASAAFGSQSGNLERAIRLALLANGVCCLLAGIGFVIDSTFLIYVTINIGMGGAVLIATLLLCVFFWRQRRRSQPPHLDTHA